MATGITLTWISRDGNVQWRRRVYKGVAGLVFTDVIVGTHWVVFFLGGGGVWTGIKMITKIKACNLVRNRELNPSAA